MSDEQTPPERKNYDHITVQSIPADDPIFSEGLIILFPIVPRPVEKTDDEKREDA